MGSYLSYEETFTSPKLLIVDYGNSLHPTLPFVSQHEGIYGNILYGTAFCDENDFALAYGEFCEAGEILLTDYLADAFVACSPEHDGYASITEKGFWISGVHFTVSGIIDTDYEKYLDRYADPDFLHSPSYLDYFYAMQNVYALIYQSLEAHLESDAIWYMPIQQGNRVSNVYAIEKSSSLFDGVIDASKPISLTDCYINEALQAELGEATRIRTVAGYVNVKGVVSDGLEEGTLYVPDMKLKELKAAPFSSIQAIVTMLDSSDEVAFLSEYDMTHYTSLSDSLQDVIRIISLASRIFLFLAILLTTFVFVAVLSTVNKLLRADRIAIALLKIGGYATRSILALEAWKPCILFALSSVASSLLYFSSSHLLNAALSSSFDAEINLLILDAKTFLLTAAILLGEFAAASALSLVIHGRKRIIALLS